jgi:hypothetical protein
MPNHAELDAQLNQMILTGKVMEAFEQFYGEDVVMQENFDAPKVGKAKCREAEMEFFGKVEAFHGSKMPASAANGDVSFAEWEYDITFKGAPRMKMNQVSVRRWKDGKVVHERFYYKAAH